MEWSFRKYQGTGNDFIILHDPDMSFPSEDIAMIEHLCHRRFGIGADGLMLVRPEDGYDFRMVYFNADGRESTMCGNGGRCIAAFAHQLGLASEEGRFMAIDGPHEYQILKNGAVRLKMIDVESFQTDGEDIIMNTGSPHFVSMRKDVSAIDIVPEARAIRYNAIFAKEGINVNFVEERDGQCTLRTYERGVEDETYSCGTGTVAAALALAIKNAWSNGPVLLNTKGGQLKVWFEKDGAVFRNIWLEGPAEHVFSGQVTI
jgi:diaminopimelate epimerase